MSLYKGNLVIEGKERQVYEHAELYFYYNDEGKRVHINIKNKVEKQTERAKLLSDNEYLEVI